jgi:hypothetical protein
MYMCGAVHPSGDLRTWSYVLLFELWLCQPQLGCIFHDWTVPHLDGASMGWTNWRGVRVEITYLLATLKWEFHAYPRFMNRCLRCCSDHESPAFKNGSLALDGWCALMRWHSHLFPVLVAGLQCTTYRPVAWLKLCATPRLPRKLQSFSVIARRCIHTAHWNPLST